MQLAGKVAVVTGASSGIGEATAHRLATAGMRVVAVARRGDRLDALAARHTHVHPYVADVTDTGAVDALAGWVGETFGVCHALVNSAGVRGQRFVGRESLAEVQRTLDVNFLGVARCMAAFHDLLADSAPSRVVNIGSVAGKLGVGPGAYAASKFAVVGFSEAVGLDWSRQGITVCQLNPGFTHTEGFSQEQLLASPAARLVVDAGTVAEAVADVLRSGARERTVPRFYRAIVALRHVAAPVFWPFAARVARARADRR